MKRILVVFGTRPEAIKMAPLVLLLKRTPGLSVALCVTAQHREMLDQVLAAFSLTADYDLDIMQPGQDLSSLTARLIVAIGNVLSEYAPDVVLVHGDTATTMSAAVAAYYARTAVGHVEAGLRTHDKYSPWPEEMNRQITGRIADYHFAPTQGARENLLREAVPDQKIHVTGNTVIDALLLCRDRLQTEPEFHATALASLDTRVRDVIQQDRFILVTAHRRESFGQGFQNICEALRVIAQRYPDVQIVYPVHRNPNVRDPVFQELSGISNVHLTEPLAYAPFVLMMDRAFIVLTDSGGIQEEAPSLGKPVLVMRDTTERPEAVEAGTVELVGTDTRKMVSRVTRLLDDPSAYRLMAGAHNPYGDGRACQRIVDVLVQDFCI